ncbi:hypothetical protein NL676_003826 [Syzygium grande]|nr:hypothetical protein NL676_003826 [Syzygium grande]
MMVRRYNVSSSANRFYAVSIASKRWEETVQMEWGEAMCRAKMVSADMVENFSTDLTRSLQSRQRLRMNDTFPPIYMGRSYGKGRGSCGLNFQQQSMHSMECPL